MRELRFSVATKRRYESVVCLSVCPSVRPYVMLLLFGVLGATYAVHMAYFPMHSLCLDYNNLTSTQILSSSLVFWAAAQMGTDLWNHHKQATIIFFFFLRPIGSEALPADSEAYPAGFTTLPVGFQTLLAGSKPFPAGSRCL